MEFNGTFFASIISFLVFVFLMNKVLYAPMEKIVAERRRVIDENYNSADEFADKAQKLETKVQEELDTAKDNARQKYDEILGSFKEQKSEIVKQAQDSSLGELETSYEALNNVSNEAKENLKSRMTDLANDIAEKILGYRSEVKGFDNDSINKILYH